jgi:hypothetical protein
MAQLWWQNIGDAMSGDKTPQEALDALCAEQEKVLERIERAGVQGDIGPKMNEEQDAQIWLDAPGAPVAKLENEKPQGETIDYDTLIKSWNGVNKGRAACCPSHKILRRILTRMLEHPCRCVWRCPHACIAPGSLNRPLIPDDNPLKTNDTGSCPTVGSLSDGKTRHAPYPCH